VYSRQIDDQVLTLSASGWTYEHSFVLYDYETESMWRPVNVGEAGIGCGCVMWGIGGQHAGQILPALPSENTLWYLWFAQHPDTKLMKPDSNGPSKSDSTATGCD